MSMEFTIDLGKQEKKREKNLVSRLDALEDETALDLPTLALRLDALARKFNASYAVVNFQMAYGKGVLYDIIEGVRVDGVESDMLSFDESVTRRKSGDNYIPRGYTGIPKFIKVVYKRDFASILMESEKQEHVLYTWSNKILDAALTPMENREAKVKRLTYRILNAVITAYIQGKGSHQIDKDPRLMKTIEYLVTWLDGMEQSSREYIISHWKYGLGFIKLVPTYKVIVAKIYKEMEAK